MDMPGSNRLKLSTVLAVVTAIAFGIASLIAIRDFEDKMLLQFRAVLETSVQSRIQELGNYASSVENDLKIVGSISLVQKAVGEFSSAFRILGSDPKVALQRIYIRENPHDAKSRHKLQKAGDGSEYSRLHGEYHAWFSKLAEVRDYYDIFLVDSEGNIVYTVFKEDDLGTNVLTGALRDTPIAEIYRRALDASPGSVVGSAFARYEPSENIPASFHGTPLHHDGRVAGAVLFQLRLDPFNQIMQSVHQLGKSFESYVVNADRLMLSESRFAEKSILALRVDNLSVKNAIAGATGFGIVNNYHGAPVLSAYSPFNSIGIRWAVLAEVDEDELNRISMSLRLTLMVAGLLVVVTSALLGWFIAARE